MTTDELLTLLKDWGFTLALVGGQPRLCGDGSRVTPELRRVLGFHRDEIIRRLGGTVNGHEKDGAKESQKANSHSGGNDPDAGKLPRCHTPEIPGTSEASLALGKAADTGPTPDENTETTSGPVRELNPVFLDGPTTYPPEGATIECLWDDGEARLYPDGAWPVRPVAWRLPGEAAWHRLREAEPERWDERTTSAKRWRHADRGAS